MGWCLTRAELLEEGVSSHLQSSRAGEAPTQGDVTGHDSAEAWHGTTCRKRRDKGGLNPCRAVCAPQLQGMTQVQHFRTRGDPQQSDPTAPQHRGALELRLSLLVLAELQDYTDTGRALELDVNTIPLPGGPDPP